jgi:ABC-type multidrug transport system fused ATPase/permease subunit
MAFLSGVHFFFLVHTLNCVQTLKATPDIKQDSGIQMDAGSLQGSLVLEDVEFAYQMRPNQKVLDGINLTVNKGEVCALVGKSGGGKSTLVHLMMRFYDPKAGRILLDGMDLTTLNLRSVHRQCGLVAQDTQLFATTIRENIAYGLDEEFASGQLTEEDIINAAIDANAHEFILKFEDQYNTKVGERGVRISGGQKQRIALARVFLRKPRLLFLDEATSALDAESEGAVQDALDRLIARKESTVILVAHRLSTVINADKIAVINDGKVAEVGSHKELVANEGGIYHRLVSKQMVRCWCPTSSWVGV